MLAAVEFIRISLPRNVVSTSGVSTIVATMLITRLSAIDMASAKLRDIHLRWSLNRRARAIRSPMSVMTSHSAEPTRLATRTDGPNGVCQPM